MKTNLSTPFFALLLALCAFSSCSKLINDSPVEEMASHVRVNICPFSLSMEDMGATRAALSDVATRLSFAVFNSDDDLVGSVIHQEVTDDNFGTVEVALFPGSYKLVAVAHNGEGDATINSVTSVTLPDTILTDTSADVEELTIESGEDCEFNMQLPRVTSSFVLRLTDTPPTDVENIEIIVNTGGMYFSTLGESPLKINPSNGLAENNWKIIRTIPIADFNEGDVPIHFLSMYPVSVVNVKITADDTNNTNYTLSNVSFTPNKRTVATGSFFTSLNKVGFTVSDWDTDNEISY